MISAIMYQLVVCIWRNAALPGTVAGRLAACLIPCPLSSCIRPVSLSDMSFVEGLSGRACLLLLLLLLLLQVS
jgi:hypothetical protein